MMPPPTQVVIGGRSSRKVNDHTGTSTISVWANTVMAAAGTSRDATLNISVPITMITAPCSSPVADVDGGRDERLAVGEGDRTADGDHHHAIALQHR